MTAPDLSPAEAARVAEFDAAPYPAEVLLSHLRRPAAPSEPPAEAQQRDEWRSVYGWVLRGNARDKAVAEGFLARMHEGMSDDEVLKYIAGALASERDAALAARPSDDTETLRRVLMDHQTTGGMRVSMGWTCACGWWSPNQSPAAITAHQAEQLRAALDGDR